MGKRFTHFHSLVIGAGGGLLVATHTLWIATVCLLLGFALGRGWHGVRHGATVAGSLVQERIETERERRKNVRASRREKLERAKVSRDKLERAYKRGVIDGHLDAA